MKRDDIIFDIIEKEHQRQLKGIELIASENFVSDQVMQAMGSCLTNKYAEGYPGKRYYGGCEVVDQSEQIAIERLKEIFGAEWANVQPHSGAQANAAVFLAVLNPGDKFMGLNLAHGGHLSHTHTFVIPFTRVCRTATDNQFWFLTKSDFFHLVVINASCFLIQIIFARSIDDARSVHQ